MLIILAPSWRRQERSGVQDQSWWRIKFEANLGSMRPCFRKKNKVKWSQTLVFGLGDVTLSGRSRALHTQNLEFGSSALQKQQTHLSGTEHVQALFLSTSHELPSAIRPNHGSKFCFISIVLLNKQTQAGEPARWTTAAKWQSGAWLKAGSLHCFCTPTQGFTVLAIPTSSGSSALNFRLTLPEIKNHFQVMNSQFPLGCLLPWFQYGLVPWKLMMKFAVAVVSRGAAFPW